MMSEWWWLIAIVVVAVLAVLFFRDRQARGRRGDHQVGPDAGRDFRAEREDTRLTGMSAEDREWESASLRRNQETRDQADKLAEPPTAADADATDRGPRA